MTFAFAMISPSSLMRLSINLWRLFLMNLDLSSRRANNVYEYILKNTGLNDYQKRFVKKHMIGIGYSFSHRLLDNSETDTSKDPSSRRIEFRIISK